MLYQKIKKRIIVCIVLLLTTVLTAAITPQPTTPESTEAIQSLTLNQVREYAVKYSAETHNARLDVRRAKKVIWETTTIGLPQINGKISYMDNVQLPTTLIPAKFFDQDASDDEFIGVKFGTQHNATLDLTATQLVFSGSYIVALQASKVYLRLSEEQVLKSEVEIKDTVSRTYYLILLAEANKKTLEANLENVKKTLTETRELLKAGFIEDTDVDQLQLSVTDLENALHSINRQISVTYALLKYQMGFDMNKEIRLADTLDNLLNQIDSQELLNTPFQVDQHIDYRILDTQEKSQELLVRREKSEYLPSITAFVSHTQNAMRDKFDFFNFKEKWFPSTVVGLNINIPIFSFGQRGARVAQAKLELEKTRRSKKQVEDGLKLQLHQARANFNTALDKSRHTEANVGLAKTIYNKTQEKFTKGTATSLELTQTHSQYLKTESDYTQALVDLFNAKTDLDKALNRL